VPVDVKVGKEISRGFKECRRLYKQGAKVIFTDIDRLEKLMLAELND